MSDELTTLVQVLELYGRGVGALGRAIKFTAKGAKVDVDYAKLYQLFNTYFHEQYGKWQN